MNDRRTIVVALDFSPSSRDALLQARRLARWSGATLRAIHIIDAPTYTPVPPVLFPWPLPTHTDLTEAATEQLEEFKRGLDDDEPLEVDIRVGCPAKEITDYARDAAMLVMGTHSVEGGQKGVGTTAAACVRRADCNVLLVRRGQSGPFRGIAACIDFSSISRPVVEESIRLAARDEAPLWVVHAYHDPWGGRQPRGALADNMPDFRAQYRTAVESRLREFCEPMAHELGAIKAAYRVAEHNHRWEGFASALVQFLHETQADLAVLGTRRNWNARDFLMGSTAERVVRDARCSILAVKRQPPQASAETAA
ncbi:MAG: universal stress protein [Leptolyngbya sp. PLA3]|nr:MAG: universal stress protein [Cyanobacteria bacterium CYA]MCE7967486.1 universal stress protein [Leptolyngbya sp. PL-A3]